MRSGREEEPESARPSEDAGAVRPAFPSFGEAFLVWLRVALLSFGGPAGQIAVMHRILVEEKRWLGETRFLHALNFCMLLPGPEAQQLAVYVGWLMHRAAGGLAAGLLFILPGALAIMALSIVYALYGRIGAVEALFFGLKAGVLAIVLHAVLRIGGRALASGALTAVAAASFVALFVFDVAFPFVIAGAALAGAVGQRAGWPGFAAAGDGAGAGPDRLADRDSVLGEGPPGHAKRSGRPLAGLGAVLLVLWLAPPALLLLFLGGDHVFSEIAVFFSEMAVVTFGGAYAVLAFVAQEAVGSYGWLAPGEMLDGLGMAETTPGPLIMVVQFVGFMGAYRDPGALDPLLAGVLGGVLTTWVTFAPCFLWIFVGAPFAERLRRNRTLSAALAAITAAVVGVVLNLAFWFAIHVVFAVTEPVAFGPVRMDAPVWQTVRPAAGVLCLLAIAAAFRFRLGPVWVLAGCGGAGLALHALGVGA